MAIDPASLQLIASGGNGALNTANQMFSGGLNTAANLKLAKYQYSKELEMWNKANEYNSPASQMQRFKDAGLNPNLIYGQGNSGNSPNVLPRYQAPTARFDIEPSYNIPNILGSYQDFRIKDAQVDNLKAQADQTRANTALTTLKSLWQSANNWFNFANVDYKDAQRVSGNVGLLEFKSNLMNYQNEIAKATLQEQIRKIRASADYAEQSIPNIQAKTKQTGLLSDYQSSINKFFAPNMISQIAARLLGLGLKFR